MSNTTVGKPREMASGALDLGIGALTVVTYSIKKLSKQLKRSKIIASKESKNT